MDLAVSISPLATREFTAIVIAGFGAELLPLTNDHGDEPCAKALLPVANKAIIDYVLAWIESSGIQDVVLICPTIHRHAISNHIHSDLNHALRIDLQTYDETADSNTGTCQLLRHFASRIPNDFVVLPCDFLPPKELSLTKILDKFRADSVSDGSIATTCWYSTPAHTDKVVLPEEWNKPLPLSAIVWDTHSGTLLHVDTPDDTDLNADELELRMSLLRLYPRSKLSVKYHDSHVYVCRRSVLTLLAKKPSFHSFREEFIPWLCKVPFQHKQREKYSKDLNHLTNTPTQKTALQHSILYDGPPTIPLADSADSADDSDSDATGSSASLRVGVVIYQHVQAARVNTLATFYDANRRVLAEITADAIATSSPTSTSAVIDQKAQVSSDTLVGPSTQIGERTTIKKSVIGRHCVIGKMVRITGCVLLDHCVVEDGAKLEGCILGKNTKVGMKAQITKCVTQAGYEVAKEDMVKNEKLELRDWTHGLDEDDNEEEEDDEEEDESDDE